jgi:hypothetical protein
LKHKTKKGYDTYEVLSALQKTIRRGMEKEAMYFALELAESDHWSILWDRLEVIVNEDIGLANPQLIVLIATLRDQSERSRKSRKKSWRLMLANAVLGLCRSAKSREADHFQCTVRLARDLEDLRLEVPDFAYDMHTSKGLELRRGLEFFREESTKLVPEHRDDYEEEAYRLWALAASKKPSPPEPKNPWTPYADEAAFTAAVAEAYAETNLSFDERPGEVMRHLADKIPEHLIRRAYNLLSDK